jgi:hypothetical protein
LSQWLRLCLASNIFAKVFFWFKGKFDKHPLGLFWRVLLQNKKGFYQTKLRKKNKNNKNYKTNTFFFLVYDQKILKII